MHIFLLALTRVGEQMEDEKPKQRRTSLDVHAQDSSISKELHQGELSGTTGRKTTFNTSEKSTWVQSEAKAEGEQLADLQKEMMKKPKGHIRQSHDGRSREDKSNTL
jgi:hypothetical protein